MRNILLLALKSLRNRKFTVCLTIISIGLSVALLLGVERIRTESRNSFTNTISGTDLVVGARSGPIQLLLYSIFRIGYATNNISWESYQDIAALPSVSWTVPISLGDSHRGYRVMGTTSDYFIHFRYGNKQNLRLDKGIEFNDLYEPYWVQKWLENSGIALAIPLSFPMVQEKFLLSNTRTNHLL